MINAKTRLATDPNDLEAKIVAVCIDAVGLPHVWDADRNHRTLRTPILRRPKSAPLARDALKLMHPELNLDELRPVQGTIPADQFGSRRPASPQGP